MAVLEVKALRETEIPKDYSERVDQAIKIADETFKNSLPSAQKNYERTAASVSRDLETIHHTFQTYLDDAEATISNIKDRLAISQTPVETVNALGLGSDISSDSKWGTSRTLVDSYIKAFSTALRERDIEFENTLSDRLKTPG